MVGLICINCGYVGEDIEVCPRCEAHGWASDHLCPLDETEEYNRMYLFDDQRDKGILLAFDGKTSRGEEPPWKRARRLGGPGNKAADQLRKRI